MRVVMLLVRFAVVPLFAVFRFSFRETRGESTWWRGGGGGFCRRSGGSGGSGEGEPGEGKRKQRHHEKSTQLHVG